MELIPRAVIAGLFVQSQLISTGPASVILRAASPPVTRDTINRIWSDVVRNYPTYQSLQFEPTGAGGAFLGAGPDDAVVIQPPLVQVRDRIAPEGVSRTAEKLGFVFQQVVHHLGGMPPQNLGVKLIYNAPAPGNDGVAFVLSELLKASDDVSALAGGMNFVGSVKYQLSSADLTYTLAVEPFNPDPTMLFIDLDAQFAGAVDVAHIRERVMTADAFLTTQVRSFLERRAEEWSR